MCVVVCGSCVLCARVLLCVDVLLLCAVAARCGLLFDVSVYWRFLALLFAGVCYGCLRSLVGVRCVLLLRVVVLLLLLIVV